MAKVHKSVRIDEEIYTRMEEQRSKGETDAALINRVLSAGCSSLEAGEEKQTTHDAELTIMREYVDTLKDTNAELADRVRNYERRIEEKDRQLAEAMAKAHELADQAHVLLGRNQEIKALPHVVEAQKETNEANPTNREEPETVATIEDKKTFGERMRDFFGM